MAQRLDNRSWLEGETRLTDAQVIALRGADALILRKTSQGWFVAGHIAPVSPRTLANLEARIAIELLPDGEYRATGRGRTLLAKINAAEAA